MDEVGTDIEVDCIVNVGDIITAGVEFRFIRSDDGDASWRAASSLGAGGVGEKVKPCWEAGDLSGE